MFCPDCVGVELEVRHPDSILESFHCPKCGVAFFICHGVLYVWKKVNGKGQWVEAKDKKLKVAIW